MEQIEGSETSAIRIKTPGNYPKENITYIVCLDICILYYFTATTVKSTKLYTVNLGGNVVFGSENDSALRRSTLLKFGFLNEFNRK